MSKRVYLITGCNRGIGKGIVEQLLKQKDNNKQIILTARTSEKAELAYKELCSKYPDSKHLLDYYKLDIENITDAKLAENYIKEKHGYLSVLINNAGYWNRDPGNKVEEKVEDIIKTFSINFFSQILVTNTFIPLILKAPQTVKTNLPHIIFVSSLIGKRTFKNEQINKDLEHPNLVQLESLYYNYLEDVRNGEIKNWDYECCDVFKAYGPSKAFLNSYMVYLSKILTNKNIMVNAFNPGWVKTDMGGDEAPLSIEEGCQTCLYLDSFSEFKTGKVYENKELIDF